MTLNRDERCRVREQRQGLRNLVSDCQSFVQRYWTAADAIGKCRAFEQFEHKSSRVILFFDPLDSRDVWMIK